MYMEETWRIMEVSGVFPWAENHRWISWGFDSMIVFSPSSLHQWPFQEPIYWRYPPYIRPI
jgi:hypothetical protein